MLLDFAALSALERYKLFVGLVYPRPIALISTRSENGVDNCAPFSFFNVLSEDPPVVIVSFGPRHDGQIKHSIKNILRTGEFVVNLVDEAIANGMHISADEIPEDESEFETAGFTPAPCVEVKHPRIAEAPASFECRTMKHIELVRGRDFIFGEVLRLHVRDGLVDPVTKRVSEDYRPVGRLYANRYCTTRQRFSLPGALPD